MNSSTLTKAQIDEAIAQMVVDCEIREQTYEMLSARGCLLRLGYLGEELDQVLRTIAERGFDYCLDPSIKQSSSMHADYPPYEACVWGPDQLKSRLECVTR